MRVPGLPAGGSYPIDSSGDVVGCEARQRGAVLLAAPETEDRLEAFDQPALR